MIPYMAIFYLPCCCCFLFAERPFLGLQTSAADGEGLLFVAIFLIMRFIHSAFAFLSIIFLAFVIFAIGAWRW